VKVVDVKWIVEEIFHGNGFDDDFNLILGSYEVGVVETTAHNKRS
jgi:hypothetical protein